MSFGLGSLSHIRELCVMLPLISSAGLYIVLVLQPKLVQELNERLWSSLRPAAQKSHQLALQTDRWCIQQREPEVQSIEYYYYYYYDPDELLARVSEMGIKLALASPLTASASRTLPRARTSPSEPRWCSSQFTVQPRS